MTNTGIVNIHGKDYMTVARRVELAHEDNIESILTEVLQHSPVVVLKATVVVKGKTFTGISSANPAKSIEKSNPYEVAETSAVGRALGFAGYGLIEGIASADEMVKSGFNKEEDYGDALPDTKEEKESKVCSAHDTPIRMFRGQSKSKFDDEGNPKVYWWHKSEEGMCFGNGYQ